MIIITENTQWRVTLKDGRTLGIWAAAVGESDDHYTFEVLIEATAEEQRHPKLIIAGKAPLKPERVSIAVARIPKASVAEVETTDWDSYPEVP